MKLKLSLLSLLASAVTAFSATPTIRIQTTDSTGATVVRTLTVTDPGALSIFDGAWSFGPIPKESLQSSSITINGAAISLGGSIGGLQTTTGTLALAGFTITGTLPAAQLPAFTGDMSTSAGSSVTTIGASKVTNAMLAGSIALSKLLTDPLARANHTGTQAYTTITGLGTAALLSPASIGAASTLAYYNTSGNLVTAAYANGSPGNLTGAGNIFLPDNQGLQWMDATTGATLASILNVGTHSNGSELTFNAPRICFMWTNGFQLGWAQTARDGAYIYLRSSSATSGDTKRESRGFSWQSATWTSGAALGNDFTVQAVPLDTSGTNSVLKFIANAAVNSGTGIWSGTDSLWLSTSGPILPTGRVLTFADATTQSTAATGTNTGDQTITLTGNVTGSGNGSFATTIAASAVTNAMLAGSIAYSKLSLTGAILNADLAGSITASKLVGTDIATVGTITSGTWSGSFGAVSGANLTALTAANITASTTAGRGILNLTNPGAISFVKIAADNSASTRTPAQVLSDIGAQASGSYAASGDNTDVTSLRALATGAAGAGQYSLSTAASSGFYSGINLTANGRIDFYVKNTAYGALTSSGIWDLTASNGVRVPSGTSIGACGLQIGGSIGDGFYRASTNDLQFGSNSTLIWAANGTSGSLGVGSGAPTATGITAFLHISPSTTARASIRIGSGTAPTTPNGGDIWYDGTSIALADGLSIANAKNIVFATSTGTKIGTGTTQKLSFWNATPIAQPTRAGAITDNSGGTSGAPTIASVAAANVDTTAASLTTTRNAVATLAAMYNSLEAKLSAAGGGSGLTAKIDRLERENVEMRSVIAEMKAELASQRKITRGYAAR